jgi:hypothetical protein
MKKAAILISGILREYSNMENINDFIIKCNPDYEFDIFLSFYDVNCRNTIKLYNENDLTTLEKVDVEDVINKYKPKSYTIVNFMELNNILTTQLDFFINNHLYNDIIVHTRNGNRNAYNTLGQLYSVEMVKNIFQEYSCANNIDYDLVIRYRYDLFTSEPIIFKDYDLNNIHGINNQNCYPSDWIFFGNSVNMVKFMHLYSNFVDKKIQPDIPEHMFKQNANGICNLLYTIKDTFKIIHNNHL